MKKKKKKKTKLPETTCMKQNLSNAIIHCGHANGVVSLWSPNTGNPLVKMLAHTGPVNDLTIENTGK
jgi:U3 small nucleolar RNA-associated protein 7